MADHYNLGNRFYEQWLDPSVTYSSGFYDGTDDLAEAQRAKYDRVLNRAGITAGANVLEIGCGWGGFAEAATAVGARITGVTIAQEQLDYAEKRAAQGGWSHASDFQLRDFADATGRYDAIVSIEMIEAVGQEFWPGFFQAIDRVLAPGGRVGIQAITIPDQRFDQYVRHADWIQKHIFPGGLLPCLREVCAVTARHTRLAVTDVEDRPLDYATTLRHWRARFLARLDEVRVMGFDERFIRTWEYYLASCEAAFRTRNLGLAHLSLARVGEDLT